MSYGSTLGILLFFGTFLLIVSSTIAFTRFMISLKGRANKLGPKFSSKDEKHTKCNYFLSSAKTIGKAVVDDVALIFTIICALLAYVDTTLY